MVLGRGRPGRPDLPVALVDLRALQKRSKNARSPG